MAVVSESQNSSKEHGASVRTYIYVWVALLVLTVLELGASLMDSLLGAEITTILILVFTLAKAALVAGFFMHLLYERRRNFLVLTIFILPVLIVVPMITLIILLPLFF
jgi:caa(3)-type oxidase subunit IV